MKQISEITAAFVDHEGLYLPLAQKLSESYGRVLYWDPTEEAFDTVNQAVIGDASPENPRLQRIDDFWRHKKEIDLAIFPDSKGTGMQLELESQGIPVWGSRRSVFLEQSRETFHRVLGDLGLDVPKFERVIGITALCEYLKPRENQIIKISKFRGTMETKKWESWDEDEAWLDLLAVLLGGVKEIIPFLVFESIDTDLEIGGDTYCVGGKFPGLMLDGTEWKDKAFFGALKERDQMPEQTKAILDAFAPILGKTGHANFWSMEIRVKGDNFYFIDCTPRAPLPGSASQMELYSNLPEIISAGAEGELIEPQPAAHFSAECCVTIKHEKNLWPSVRVPSELKQWLKLASTVTVDGRSWFPPIPNDQGDEAGWLVAIGDTPIEAIETLKGYVALLPDGLSAHIEALADIIKEIETAKDSGINITDEAMPEPQSVISDE